eukprot:gene11538-7958_t
MRMPPMVDALRKEQPKKATPFMLLLFVCVAATGRTMPGRLAAPLCLRGRLSTELFSCTCEGLCAQQASRWIGISSPPGAKKRIVEVAQHGIGNRSNRGGKDLNNEEWVQGYRLLDVLRRAARIGVAPEENLPRVDLSGYSNQPPQSPGRQNRSNFSWEGTEQQPAPHDNGVIQPGRPSS